MTAVEQHGQQVGVVNHAIAVHIDASQIRATVAKGKQHSWTVSNERQAKCC